MSDFREMQELAATGQLSFEAQGDPRVRYRVSFRTPGLALEPDGRLAVRTVHHCEIYLHRDYPRRPPVVTWCTPVFHPNLLRPERNGGVCLGGWSPSEGLAEVCLRLREMVAYRSLNAIDALDLEAAEWVRLNGVAPGADVAMLATLPLPGDRGVARRASAGDDSREVARSG